MDYVSTLDNIFSKLIDDIGYIYIDSDRKLRYVQKNGKLRIRNIYFDLKQGGFIKYSTVRNNKKVIMKLTEYQAQGNLLCFVPTEEGYLVRVINKYGELIYKQYIKFFDKLNRLQMWFMKKRYPELALDS
jgi:hypothetical protein